MITKREKAWVHIYADAAGLTDAEYRALLEDKTGKRSCADPDFTHANCDTILAALEAVLFDRVDRGEVPDPRGRHKYIKDEHHFRRRIRGPGFITTRQHHETQELWTDLQQFLPEENRGVDYVTRIIAKATGRTKLGNGSGPLKQSEAANVIDALKDRLKYAIRQAQEHPTDVPFWDRHAQPLLRCGHVQAGHLTPATLGRYNSRRGNSSAQPERALCHL